jgi:hypothetical protein
LPEPYIYIQQNRIWERPLSRKNKKTNKQTNKQSNYRIIEENEKENC